MLEKSRLLASLLLGWNYWKDREEGKGHEQLIRRRDNPLWDVFKKEFAEKQGRRER